MLGFSDAATPEMARFICIRQAIAYRSILFDFVTIFVVVVVVCFVLFSFPPFHVLSQQNYPAD